jgi:hypothetical protein
MGDYSELLIKPTAPPAPPNPYANIHLDNSSTPAVVMLIPVTQHTDQPAAGKPDESIVEMPKTVFASQPPPPPEEISEEISFVYTSPSFHWHIFKYTQPSPTRARGWKMLLVIAAVFEMAIALTLGIVSTIVLISNATSGPDGEPTTNISKTGAAAVSLGFIAFVALLGASIAAIIAANNTQTRHHHIAYAAFTNVIVALFAGLVLVVVASTSGAAATPSAADYAKMIVFCVVSTVGILVTVIFLTSIVIAIFLRHKFPTLCDED